MISSRIKFFPGLSVHRRVARWKGRCAKLLRSSWQHSWRWRQFLATDPLRVRWWWSSGGKWRRGGTPAVGWGRLWLKQRFTKFLCLCFAFNELFHPLELFYYAWLPLFVTWWLNINVLLFETAAKQTWPNNFVLPSLLFLPFDFPPVQYSLRKWPRGPRRRVSGNGRRRPLVTFP